MSSMKTTETALERVDERSSELQPTQASSGSIAEIQGAIIIAHKFPRNEDSAFGALMKSCGSSSFAEEAIYKFPRGGKPNCAHDWDWSMERCKRCAATLINGPSVNIAREAARTWGNIRSGLRIIADTDESRLIEGWAWDLETNRQVSAQTQFAKLIKRKSGWITPNERDLRELTNRHGSILVRNCLLELMPKHLIRDAMDACIKTLTTEAAKDPEAQKKKLIIAFSEIGVSVEALEKFLGHELSACSPSEYGQLRQIYRSIVDGNTTWAEYAGKPSSSAESEASESSESDGTLFGKDEKPKEEERPLNEHEKKLVLGLAEKRGFDEKALKDHIFTALGYTKGLEDVPASRLDELLNTLTESDPESQEAESKSSKRK